MRRTTCSSLNLLRSVHPEYVERALYYGPQAYSTSRYHILAGACSDGRRHTVKIWRRSRDVRRKGIVKLSLTKKQTRTPKHEVDGDTFGLNVACAIILFFACALWVHWHGGVEAQVSVISTFLNRGMGYHVVTEGRPSFKDRLKGQETVIASLMDDAAIFRASQEEVQSLDES